MTTQTTDPVSRALQYLVEHADEQPGLEVLAAQVGLSPTYLQRTFTRRVGVSPKRFLQFMTVEHAKGLLDRSLDVLQTSLEVGLSGPGRLHDHFVSLEAVSPGEYKARGAGLEIRWGRADSPFGEVLLAATSRGICGLYFPRTVAERRSVQAELTRQWSGAELVADPGQAAALAERIFTQGLVPHRPLSVLVRGTNFQVRVWRALLAVPEGTLLSYGQLGARVGVDPRAARAVGQAVGANPVSWLIPCHRVIRAAGTLGGYRWGLGRKRAMIAWESARAAAPSYT